MRKEDETQAERELDKFKQNVFAHAYSAFDRQVALKAYYDDFEKKPQDEDFDYEEYEPEDEVDVMEMLEAARRAGAIS